jgi:hypothetical protein
MMILYRSTYWGYLENHPNDQKNNKLSKTKLVGGLEHFLFFHILGIMIPTDFHIFRGVETTNQKIIQICFSVWILRQFG